ncbi:type IV pilus modification protein PilV, partial [Acinetobacter baumannii]
MFFFPRLAGFPFPGFPLRGRSRGFSMMEVLVAMLVIGTGALAIAMLQLHALRSSQDSSLHARATLMAQELAELRNEKPTLQDLLDNPSSMKRLVIKEIEGD